MIQTKKKNSENRRKQRNCLIRCNGIEDIDLASKRERKLARILDRDFRGRNVEGVGGNVFDGGADVFYSVGSVMDMLVGGVGVVVFGGDDLVHGVVHCCWWKDRIWGFGSVTLRSNEVRGNLTLTLTLILILKTNPNPVRREREGVVGKKATTMGITINTSENILLLLLDCEATTR